MGGWVNGSFESSSNGLRLSEVERGSHSIRSAKRNCDCVRFASGAGINGGNANYFDSIQSNWIKRERVEAGLRAAQPAQTDDGRSTRVDSNRAASRLCHDRLARARTASARAARVAVASVVYLSKSLRRDESRNPLANGLLSIFSLVI